MVDKIKPEDVALLMKSYVDAGHAQKAADKCDASYQFNLAEVKDGPIKYQFWVSLKKSAQSSGLGKMEKPDATFTMTASDFFDVCMGKLNPQMAFIKKKMKITGNFKKATVFTPELFPPPTPENFLKYSGGTIKL